MSREIKFRSWNEEEKVFYYFFKGLVFDCPIKIKEYNHVGGNNFYKFNWDNAEQFTGLTDKNGKEIYEGDKLLVLYNYIGVQVVEFNQGSFNVSKYNLERCEVIGNIHEK